MNNGVNTYITATYMFDTLCLSCRPSDKQPTMLSKATKWWLPLAAFSARWLPCLQATGMRMLCSSSSMREKRPGLGKVGRPTGCTHSVYVLTRVCDVHGQLYTLYTYVCGAVSCAPIHWHSVINCCMQ